MTELKKLLFATQALGQVARIYELEVENFDINDPKLYSERLKALKAVRDSMSELAERGEEDATVFVIATLSNGEKEVEVMLPNTYTDITELYDARLHQRLTELELKGMMRRDDIDDLTYLLYIAKTLADNGFIFDERTIEFLSEADDFIYETRSLPTEKRTQAMRGAHPDLVTKLATELGFDASIRQFDYWLERVTKECKKLEDFMS